MPSEDTGSLPDLKSLSSFLSHPDKLAQYKGQVVVVKYGGNAMKKPELQLQVAQALVHLRTLGLRPVVVHGGGPAIASLLKRVGEEPEFIGGHRKTTVEAMRYVEMALRGEVNGQLVQLLNRMGAPAVGLSGKDARFILAEKRYHHEDGVKSDLGQVGNVKQVNPDLLMHLLGAGYMPVVAPVGAGEGELGDFNINADMAAGHVAAALKAAAFVVLTDVDGLRKDKDDPDTLIPEIGQEELPGLMHTVIQGGMIPKIEACQIALEGGVQEVHLINGTQPQRLLETLLQTEKVGTTLKRTS